MTTSTESMDTAKVPDVVLSAIDEAFEKRTYFESVDRNRVVELLTKINQSNQSYKDEIIEFGGEIHEFEDNTTVVEGAQDIYEALDEADVDDEAIEEIIKLTHANLGPHNLVEGHWIAIW